MDRDTARTALDAAARRRDETRDAYDAADEELRQAMRDADGVGVSHVEIARRAGVHRNTVARVVGDTARRDPGNAPTCLGDIPDACHTPGDAPMATTEPTPDIVREQLERARLDNRDEWRSAGITMLVLLVIGIGIPLIPVVALVTLVSTRRNERDARAGLYGPMESRINESALTRWIGFIVLAGLGVALLIGGWGLLAWAISLALIGGGVALRPWHYRLRVP